MGPFDAASGILLDGCDSGQAPKCHFGPGDVKLAPGFAIIARCSMRKVQLQLDFKRMQ